VQNVVIQGREDAHERHSGHPGFPDGPNAFRNLPWIQRRDFASNNLETSVEIVRATIHDAPQAGDTS
jgi:hypothetical protein